MVVFFFSSRRRHTRLVSDWSSDVCSSDLPPRMKIAQIRKDPGKYMNKQITVAGKVTRAFGAMGMGIFEIDDGTGQMWVLSESFGVPGRSEERRVGKECRSRGPPYHENDNR